MEWHEVFKGVAAEQVPAEVLEEELEERRGLFGRLRRNLGKARGAVVDQLKGAVYVGVDRRLYEQVEELLIAADVGVDGTIKIVDELEQRCTAKKIEMREPFMNELAAVIGDVLRPDDPEEQRIDVAQDPSVILMVGVNGTGKTTTIGKIAWRLKELGKTPLMVAGDTFRAAAVEQLTEWSERVGCEIVKQAQGGDPAAVVYDGVAAARSRGADVVLIDTAGRLHTQVNLMRELEKVRRVIEKQLPGAPHETLLVLDATTGQNGLRQAQEFQQAVDVSGIVLTKLDGTAKGGIVVAIHESLGIPIKLIGIGEQTGGPAALRARAVRRAIFGRRRHAGGRLRRAPGRSGRPVATLRGYLLWQGWPGAVRRLPHLDSRADASTCRLARVRVGHGESNGHLGSRRSDKQNISPNDRATRLAGRAGNAADHQSGEGIRHEDITLGRPGRVPTQAMTLEAAAVQKEIYATIMAMSASPRTRDQAIASRR